MATMGYTTIGGGARTFQTNGACLGCLFTAPADIAQVTSIHAYLDQTGVHGSGVDIPARLIIYEYDADNTTKPKALVANSDIEVTTAMVESTPQWYVGTYPTKPFLTAGAQYWLCVQCERFFNYYIDGGASDQLTEGRSGFSAYARGAPDPWTDEYSTTPATDSKKVSIYVTYAVGDNPPTEYAGRSTTHTEYTGR